MSEVVETRLYYMGLCPSTPRRFIIPEVRLEHSTENSAELLDTPMSERFEARDYNSFLELHNKTANFAKRLCEEANALSSQNYDLKKQTEQLTKENQNLRRM